jgi:hypothetical protein
MLSFCSQLLCRTMGQEPVLGPTSIVRDDLGSGHGNAPRARLEDTRLGQSARPAATLPVLDLLSLLLFLIATCACR